MIYKYEGHLQPKYFIPPVIFVLQIPFIMFPFTCSMVYKGHLCRGHILFLPWFLLKCIGDSLTELHPILDRWNVFVPAKWSI